MGGSLKRFHDIEIRVDSPWTDADIEPDIDHFVLVQGETYAPAPGVFHFGELVIADAIGIRFNDRQRFDVEEYCISEGWIKVPAGKTVDRKGRPLLLKLKGKVEAFYR